MSNLNPNPLRGLTDDMLYGKEKPDMSHTQGYELEKKFKSLFGDGEHAKIATEVAKAYALEARIDELQKYLDHYKDDYDRYADHRLAELKAKQIGKDTDVPTKVKQTKEEQ